MKRGMSNLMAINFESGFVSNIEKVGYDRPNKFLEMACEQELIRKF
jgi:hypothetical protein